VFHSNRIIKQSSWPSGLRRWIKAPVSSGAWVRVPPKTSSFVIFCRLIDIGNTFVVSATDSARLCTLLLGWALCRHR
jgi:hypothetical protein